MGFVLSAAPPLTAASFAGDYPLDYDLYLGLISNRSYLPTDDGFEEYVHNDDAFVSQSDGDFEADDRGLLVETHVPSSLFNTNFEDPLADITILNKADDLVGSFWSLPIDIQIGSATVDFIPAKSEKDGLLVALDAVTLQPALVDGSLHLWRQRVLALDERLSLQDIDRAHHHIRDLSTQTKDLIFDWLQAGVKDPFDHVRSRLEELIACESFEVDPLFDGVFFPSANTQDSIQRALTFFDRIEHLSQREIYLKIEALPAPFASVFRYHDSPTIFSSLTDDSAIRACDIHTRQKLMWGLMRLFSTDMTVVDPMDAFEADEGVFFGFWMDQLLEVHVANWSSNLSEAIQLFLSARAMLERDPKDFETWIDAQDEVLDVDFNYPPEAYRFSRHDLIAAEIIGLIQGTLSSPYFDVHPELRMDLALAIERMEKILQISYAHGHGYIGIGTGDDIRPILKAIMRAAGWDEERARQEVQARYDELYPRRKPEESLFVQYPADDDDDLYEYYGGD